MLLLGLDFETTGLNFKRDRIIEIGSILWDINEAKPVELFSCFVSDDTYPPMTKSAFEANQIKSSTLADHARSPFEAISFLLETVGKADFIAAHNAGFDRGFLIEECKRQRLRLPRVQWIDTATDVPYPDHISTRKLSHLAEAHEIENPCPHRALFDALTMIQILEKYDFETITEWSRSKNVLVEAELDPSESERAERFGYRFNRKHQSFRKKIKEFLLESEKQKADFPVHIINQNFNNGGQYVGR